MDTITQLKNAIEFAKQNPDAPQSIQLRRRIESGMYSNELAQIKKGSFASQPTDKSKAVKTVEKIADITGGKEIAQGLGQSLAGNTKRVEQTQNQQIDLQGQLLQRIKEKKARGEDTSRLEGALQDLGGDIQSFGNNAEEILNPNQLTSKQVIGDTLQLGSTVAGAGTLPGQVGKVATAKTIGQGIVQGAKAGAISGGAFGAIGGAAQGLQQDKTVRESLGQGLKTGAVGAVGGAVLGSVVGGISGGLAGKAERAQNKVLENITPKADEISVAEYKKLLAQGKITPKTDTSAAKYVLSDAEKNTALKYSNLIKKDPVKTTLNITDEIARQDADVGNYLQKHNAIFNTGELKNKLSSSMDEVVDLTVTDKQLASAKKKLIDSFVKDLSKNDMKTLWELRKTYDKQVERVFGKTSPTLADEMKTALRNSVQDFISEKTDDVTYKAAMKEMSSLFRLRDSAITKAGKEKAMNGIQAWIKANPVKAKALGLIGAGVVANKLGII